MARLLGKWEGRVSLEGRGICLLTLNLRSGKDPQSFAGASTFSCTGGLVPDGAEQRKDPTGLMTMAGRKLNYTSATFDGTAKDGGIVLAATDNIGVSETFQGCGMVSMTLKAFDENRLSVRWRESGQGGCTGGEMLLAHAQ
jgi:hypothetical protein